MYWNTRALIEVASPDPQLTYVRNYDDAIQSKDLEQGLSASMFNWRLQLASLDTRNRILDALQDGETNPDAVPQRTSGWYMPLTTQLTVHQKRMVSRLPSMLDEDSEVILGIVFFLIFWAGQWQLPSHFVFVFVFVFVFKMSSYFEDIGRV